MRPATRSRGPTWSGRSWSATPTCRCCAAARARLSVVVTGGAGQVAGPAGLVRRSSGSSSPASRSRSVTSTTSPATRGGWRRGRRGARGGHAGRRRAGVRRAPARRLHRVVAGRGRRGRRGRAPSEVPHRWSGGRRPSPPPTRWRAGSTRRWTARRRSSARPGCTGRSGTPSDEGFEQHGFLNVLVATRARVRRRRHRRGGGDAGGARRSALAPGADRAGGRRWFTSFGSCSIDEPLDRPARRWGWCPHERLRPRPPAVRRLLGRRRAAPGRRAVSRSAVLDLAAATGRPEFDQPSLNAFMALGPQVWAETRDAVVALAEGGAAPAYSVDEVVLHQPFEVGDYVDFYASLEHASNVGRLFRPDQEPLLPNWRHLPVGYHGRAGTVCAQRHARGPAERPAQGAGPGGADVRPEPPARHRGRARLRRGRRVAARGAGAARRVRRPRLRRGRGERLVGARHPGVGVRPARTVPRQVVRDLGVGLGDAAGRARRRVGRRCPARTRGRCPTSRPTATRGLAIDVEVVLNGEVVSRPPYASMYWGRRRCSPT